MSLTHRNSRLTEKSGKAVRMLDEVLLKKMFELLRKLEKELAGPQGCYCKNRLKAQPFKESRSYKVNENWVEQLTVAILRGQSHEIHKLSREFLRGGNQPT